MIVVESLLAANLAVLAFLVVGDRSRFNRPRPVQVLDTAQDIVRPGSSPTGLRATGRDHSCGDRVVIPFDRAARRDFQGSLARHPASRPMPGPR